MQSLAMLCFAALVACACAKVFVPVKEYPQYYIYTRTTRHPRDIRDLRQEGDMGDDILFGNIVSDDGSDSGKAVAGNKQDFFNDHGGHLSDRGYGTIVLGSYGDSSSIGESAGPTVNQRLGPVTPMPWTPFAAEQMKNRGVLETTVIGGWKLENGAWTYHYY